MPKASANTSTTPGDNRPIRPPAPTPREGPRHRRGLKAELEVLREENRRLRQEREQLQRALRRDLGWQLDQIGTAGLEVRVDELATANQKLAADLATTKQELAETQDSLAAARTSLRRMIRAENQTHC